MEQPETPRSGFRRGWFGEPAAQGTTSDNSSSGNPHPEPAGERAQSLRERLRRRRARRPATVVVLAFTTAILLGALALGIPGLRADSDGHATWDEALFTSTSAVTVTGLNIVDTATGWTLGGQIVILVLIQLGGLGLATAGTILILVMSRRLGLTTRLVAQAETPWVQLGEVRRIFRFVIKVTIICEAALAATLFLVFWLRYDIHAPKAAWQGLFHSISAFNNAGFSTFERGLVPFANDPLVLVPIMAAIIIGGLGFPVLYQIKTGWRRPRLWSVHTKMTLSATVGLLVVGAILISWFEWTNGTTLQENSSLSTILNGTFGSVTARTAGFNTIDYGEATDETILTTIVLMFIGGGSASTAGGIKVTTFLVLVFIVVAEARGSRDVEAAERRLDTGVQRAAIALATAYVLLVAVGLMVLLALTDLPIRDVLFETVSASSTVGVSTGITAELPDTALAVLCVLMFAGRLGAITLASVLALRPRQASYRLPEARPIIG